MKIVSYDIRYFGKRTRKWLNVITGIRTLRSAQEWAIVEAPCRIVRVTTVTTEKILKQAATRSRRKLK